MEIFQNEFVSISLDAQHALALCVWSTTTGDMSDEEYKTTFLQIADLYIEHQVERWLGDARNFLKVTNVELQEWVVNELNPKLVEAGLKKMALVLPAEFFASLSIEQAVDEMSESIPNSFQTQYFDKIDEAQDWLLAKK